MTVERRFDRIFLIVLDSAGIGALPDAADYGDAGSDTFRALWRSGELRVPRMTQLGLYNIVGMDYAPAAARPLGCFGRMAEQSKGKDTTIGHWEIGGIISDRPLPTYPEGFPAELLAEFSHLTGRGVLCNRPYSGTQVILDYGRQQKETGDWIVYTSADSVFQLAANEDWIPLEELYHGCEIARKLLQGDHGVGRVIARPFTGEYPHYTRTANRHDYSIPPPKETMLDLLQQAGWDTIGVGKIGDIFAGHGLNRMLRTKGNQDGMQQTFELLQNNFQGLVFVNLVDFDMLYGHRNDVMGYTRAMNAFDEWLGSFLERMGRRDLLLITADHGCDPSTESTDHSREYTPLLTYSPSFQCGIDLGIRDSFSDIAQTILDIFAVENSLAGSSFLSALDSAITG